MMESLPLNNTLKEFEGDAIFFVEHSVDESNHLFFDKHHGSIISEGIQKWSFPQYHVVLVPFW